MTINQALNWAIKELKKAKIGSAILDAEVLLGFATKKPKEWILTHPEVNLKSQEYKNIKKYIARRKKREPVAYITGTKEFYGLNFFVDKNVLIPRPETELMVEKVLEIIKYNANDANKMRMMRIPNGKKINLIDIGTGSGCVPISIINSLSKIDGRSELTAYDMKPIAIDYSAKALQIARKNATRHRVKINFIHGNLLDKILRKYGNKLNTEYRKIIITANLPYLSELQYKKLPPEIKRYEPKSALVAGKDGLDYYKELLMNIRRLTCGCRVSLLGPPAGGLRHTADNGLASRLSADGVIPDTARRTDGVILGGKTSRNDMVYMLLEIDPAQTKKIKKIISKILPGAKIEIQKDLAKRDRLVIIKIN